jgi:hypothetical protein
MSTVQLNKATSIHKEILCRAPQNTVHQLILRLRLRFAVALLLSEPATVITAALCRHFCFSLTFKNTLTLSNTGPAPSSQHSTLHSILDVNVAGNFLALTQHFLVTKNTLRSVVQDDTFDIDDTKLHSGAFITTRVRTQQIKTLPYLNELPIPITLDWTALPQRLFVIGMHCVVTGPGSDTEHWTKACP